MALKAKVISIKRGPFSDEPTATLEERNVVLIREQPIDGNGPYLVEIQKTANGLNAIIKKTTDDKIKKLRRAIIDMQHTNPPTELMFDALSKESLRSFSSTFLAAAFSTRTHIQKLLSDLQQPKESQLPSPKMDDKNYEGSLVAEMERNGELLDGLIHQCDKLKYGLESRWFMGDLLEKITAEKSQLNILYYQLSGAYVKQRYDISF